MARRRRGRALNGILVLDKPAGYSSNQALQAAKNLFGAAKAGHTGSLDPLATGVLPLCFGEATKFSQYLLDADKSYDSTFVLGLATTTGDTEGEELARTDASALCSADVSAALESFQGEIEQIPSMYSALKHQGQPLYKLARRGQEVERKARRVFIKQISLNGFRQGALAEVDVLIECSKGTYVRTLAEDLGRRLGCGGHVSRLRRTRAGAFAVEDCVSLDTLEALKQGGQAAEMDALLKSADTAVARLPLVSLSQSGGYYMRQGQPVMVPNAPCDGMVRVALETGEFLGVGEILDDGRVAPRRLIVTGR
ncbi:MAG: tRNA pseudouridine(55) synthase TruB [Pseudomonadota bacterium]